MPLGAPVQETSTVPVAPRAAVLGALSTDKEPPGVAEICHVSMAYGSGALGIDHPCTTNV